jgi:hypothetical protein
MRHSLRLPRRAYIRKTVRWVGTVVTVLLLVTWIGSAWCILRWVSSSGNCLYLHAGRVAFAHEPQIYGPIMPPGWHAQKAGPAFWWWFEKRPLITGWTMSAPLWPLVLLAPFITFAAWRFDVLARRRARLNFCPKCNYDRTGLRDGANGRAVCPECGAAPAGSSST